jgi:serine/threonine-protein kinase
MGIVLWELLTGDRLVYRRNDVQTVNRLLNDKFSPPSSVRPDIVAELDAIVMKALAKDPTERYQSAREMREALEEYLIARSHPVRQEEIGPLISELFKDERTVMRERIRHCIATAPDDSAMDNLPALSARPVDSLSSTPSGSRPETSAPFSVSSSRLSNTPGAVSGTLAATVDGVQTGSSPFPSPAAKKARVVMVTAVALAAVLGVTIYGAMGHSGAAPAATAGAVAPEKVAVPTPPAAETTPAPTPPAAEAPAAAAPAAASPVVATASPPKAQPGRHWTPPARPAAPAHAVATAAPPPPTPAPAPPPAAPTATATTHPREFNTSL